MIKGVIFDLDGTILNSLEDLGQSVNRTLKKHNLETYPMKRYNEFVGNGVHKLVERAFGKDYPKLEEAFETFYTDYSENCTVNSYLYDGIFDVLKKLNELKIPVAISTNKAQDLTDKIVEHFLSDVDFVDVIGDRFDGLKKPNPHYPLAIMDKMNLKPEEILFVGDSNVDMITANTAGFKAIGVLWGFRSKEELLKHGADQVIDDACDILKML